MEVPTHSSHAETEADTVALDEEFLDDMCAVLEYVGREGRGEKAVQRREKRVSEDLSTCSTPGLVVGLGFDGGVDGSVICALAWPLRYRPCSSMVWAKT
jgi:hypothetical protein